MAKTIQLHLQSSIEDVRKIVKTTKDEGQKTRIKIILLVHKGLSRKEISEKLDIHIDTITDVVKRYNDKGLVGLETNLGGRKEGNPKWNKKIFEDLKVEIQKQGKYWSVPIMVRWIKDNKKVSIPETTVWYNMTNVCNMSYKSARPHPYLGDKEKQEEFKKKD